jgi:hypothetical protein
VPAGDAGIEIRLRRCRFGLGGRQEPDEAEQRTDQDDQKGTGVEPGGILQMPGVTVQSNLLLQPPAPSGYPMYFGLIARFYQVKTHISAQNLNFII